MKASASQQETVQSMIVDDHDYAATQPDTKVAVIAPPAELASTLEECQESNKKLLEQIESLKSANAKFSVDLITFNVKLRTILGPIMFYRKCMICNSEVPGPILSQIVNIQLNTVDIFLGYVRSPNSLLSLERIYMSRL